MQNENTTVTGSLQTRGFERVRASLIVVAGELAGEEHPVDQPRWVLGRGPGVDAAIEDQAISECHAAIEFARGAFYLTHLSEGPPTEVNGRPVESCEVVHGDRIAIGTHVFQMLIETSGGSC